MEKLRVREFTLQLSWLERESSGEIESSGVRSLALLARGSLMEKLRVQGFAL
jgi:hypothetical protein